MKPPPDPTTAIGSPPRSSATQSGCTTCLASACRMSSCSWLSVALSSPTARRWCKKFGASFADSLRRRRPRPGDKRHMDEVFIRIQGVQHYLWRAVDQDGVVVDIGDQDLGGVMLRRFERGQRCCRWRGLGTIVRTAVEACRQGRAFGSAAAGGRRASSTASAGAWRSAC
jgi:DDE domain